MSDMDKIDFGAFSLLNPPLAKNSKQETKRPNAELRGKGKLLFSEMMDNYVRQNGELGPIAEYVPSEEALTELMDALHSAGSDLIDRPFHDEIIRYKRAVRNFINYVVENCYDVQKIRSTERKIARGGERKNVVYNQVQVLDRKLEELAAAILSGQTNQLERVSKIDEIKGLLVDLTITGVIRERDE